MRNYQGVRGNLVDMQTGEKLFFQFNPEKIGDDQGANWAAQRIHGVHHPYFQYSSGTGRTLKFQLKFYHQDVKDGKNVKQKCDWLRSTVYPDTAAGGVPHRPPHRFLLNLGSLFRGMPCIITSVSVNYDKVFSPSIVPLYAEVDLEVQEFRTRAVGYAEVRGGSA